MYSPVAESILDVSDELMYESHATVSSIPDPNSVFSPALKLIPPEKVYRSAVLANTRKPEINFNDLARMPELYRGPLVPHGQAHSSRYALWGISILR
jgi:hypothetical protein